MLKELIYLIVLVLIFLITYIKYVEYRGLYYPAREIEFYPDTIGLKFEDIYITTEDGIKINGWFIWNPESRYTLLFCHGNAGNIGNRIDKINLLSGINLNIFIIDYRGFGKSEGRLHEKGLYLDAEASYDYLLNSRNIKQEQIIIYGESLGSAVAIDLASKRSPKALIVEGSFSSGREMAKKIYPILPGFLFSNSFNSINKIKKIDCPKLFIHSKEDEVVPFKLAEKLYREAKLPKEFIELEGQHNDAFLNDKEKYITSIASFIDKL